MTSNEPPQPEPPDGPHITPPAGVSTLEWALHVSLALQETCDRVGEWQTALGGLSRLPTLEEMQGPPFNCTAEFAWRFLRWAQTPEASE